MVLYYWWWVFIELIKMFSVQYITVHVSKIWCKYTALRHTPDTNVPKPMCHCIITVYTTTMTVELPKQLLIEFIMMSQNDSCIESHRFTHMCQTNLINNILCKSRLSFSELVLNFEICRPNSFQHLNYLFLYSIQLNEYLDFSTFFPSVF